MADDAEVKDISETGMLKIKTVWYLFLSFCGGCAVLFTAYTWANSEHQDLRKLVKSNANQISQMIIDKEKDKIIADLKMELKLEQSKTKTTEEKEPDQ